MAITISIIPRAAWLALPAKTWNHGLFQPWVGGVVIHQRGEGSITYGPHMLCHSQVLALQTQKMLGGDSDIPYNFVVCHHGGIFEGRGFHHRSAANGTSTPGANSDFYAICGLLESEDQPTAEMVTSIRKLVTVLRAGGPGFRAGPHLKGHKEVYSTSCPGNLQPYLLRGEFGALAEYGDDGLPQPPKPASPLFVYSRAQWGARPPREVTRVEPGSRTGFTVHYSSGPTSQTVQQIQNYHMDSRGWADVGYNFLVDRNGHIYEGRGWNVVGAHATGHNATHIGVCFIGEDGDATPRALSAIAALYRQANQLTGKTLDQTYHGGLSGQSTQCPGAGLRAWVQGGMQAATLPITNGSDGHSGGGGSTGGMTSVRSVTSQQEAVNGLGRSPALEVDGVWGPQTDAGVRWLQQKVGADADGLWGPGTEAKYVAHTGGSGGGMTSVRSVTAQQVAVNSLGRSPALAVDGAWGPQTDAGVRWLQQKVGADADGLWGPGTEAAYIGYLDNGAMLTVDGQWGPATIRATQKVIGVAVDGQWGPGSVRGLQRHLNTWSGAGLVVDGAAGPGTYKALQKHLNNMIGAGLAVDGAWGPATVRALQTALNRGRF
ncbi:peptidoglycan recognition protein family protein [Streptomyces sp. JNUCC 64]